MTRTFVALTTTASRAELTGFVLDSVRRQSAAIDGIYVFLSQDGYLADPGFSAVPKWPGLNDSRISVEWVENTGPYRKLLPMLSRAAAGDRIVTVDDDILYGHRWLEALLAADAPNRPAILCARARRMKSGRPGKLRSYAEWPLVREPAEGFSYLPTGLGGVVYRREWLDEAFLLDREAFNLAPQADDLWFRAGAALARTPVRVVPEAFGECYEVKVADGLFQRNARRASGPRFGRGLRGKWLAWRSARGKPLTLNDTQLAAVRDYAMTRYGGRDPFPPMPEERT